MALFTIEQIELIRRLRNSGITKDQVIQAFEQLDRLDAELGRACSYRGQVTSSSNQDISSENLLHDRQLDRSMDITISNVVSMPGTGQMTNGIDSIPAQSSYKPNEYLSHQSYPRTQSNSTTSSDGIPDCNNSQNGDHSSPSSITSPTSKLSSELTIIPLSSESTCSIGAENTNVQNQTMSSTAQCSSFTQDFLPDDCYELKEFKKKGDMAILAEIRNFVMAYNIKQTMIAEMTRMSQAYVSRFFRGDVQDLPERTKNVFYMWYLTCKHNPLKLAQMCPNSGVKWMVSDGGDLIPLKRERFTFKASHLAVLEKYYERDPYPDAQTREQIVDECNKAVEKTEWPLLDKDKVTLPVVNNWFNNRRKEAKKQLRQQHAAAMAAMTGPQTPNQSTSPAPSTCSTGWSPTPGVNSFNQTQSAPLQSLLPGTSQVDLTNEAIESDSSSESPKQLDPGQFLMLDLQDEGQGKPDIKQEL